MRSGADEHYARENVTWTRRLCNCFFFFSSRRRHTRSLCDWSSDECSSDLFVDVVAESIGDAGRWLHYGLTSYDVVENALALQLKQAGSIVVAGARAYRDALVRRAREFSDTVCVGRTHGVHAEPTTFGLKL